MRREVASLLHCVESFQRDEKGSALGPPRCIVWKAFKGERREVPSGLLHQEKYLEPRAS